MSTVMTTTTFSFLGLGPIYSCQLPDYCGRPSASTVVDGGAGGREFAYFPPHHDVTFDPRRWSPIETRSAGPYRVDIFKAAENEIPAWAIKWHLSDGGIITTHIRGAQGFAAVSTVIAGIEIAETPGRGPQVLPGPGLRLQVGTRPGYQEQVLFQTRAEDLAEFEAQHGFSPLAIRFVRPGWVPPVTSSIDGQVRYRAMTLTGNVLLEVTGISDDFDRVAGEIASSFSVA